MLDKLVAGLMLLVCLGMVLCWALDKGPWG
jgi:hypothetical protein